jgi:tetrahydromethanopterin S-methyltransferase subunit F
MSAGRLNFGFAIAGIVGLIVIVVVVLLIIHAIFK